MIVHQVEQRSEAWHRLRMAIPTASDFGKIITAKTLKISTQAKPYMCRLLAAWLCGHPLTIEEDAKSDFQSQFMQRGSELEAQAYRAYELQEEVETEAVGFVTTDDGRAGCSPDRVIWAQKRGLELKCPSMPIHVGRMLDRTIDEEYVLQVQGCMWICEAETWDVVSYYPGLPIVIVRAQRDEKYVAAISTAVEAFCVTMEAAKVALTQQYGPFTRRVPVLIPDDEGLGVSEDDLDQILGAGLSVPQDATAGMAGGKEAVG